MNQILDSRQTHHISPSRASYVSVLRMLEKIDRVITAPRCMLFSHSSRQSIYQVVQVQSWCRGISVPSQRRRQVSYPDDKKKVTRMLRPQQGGRHSAYDVLINTSIIFPQCLIYASVNCVIIGSGKGLPPVRRQAITWTNANLLSIKHLGTNISEIRIKIKTYHS